MAATTYPCSVVAMACVVAFLLGVIIGPLGIMGLPRALPFPDRFEVKHTRGSELVRYDRWTGQSWYSSTLDGYMASPNPDKAVWQPFAEKP